MSKRKNRIPAPVAPAGNGHIPTPELPPSQGVLFSFKHLDLCEKFTPARAQSHWTAKLVERLKIVSFMSSQDLINSRDKEHRCHPLDWPGTSEPDGFACLPPHLRDTVEPMQFGLGKRNGRLHGFFIGETFHIVWIDPDHQLYPTR